jgi:glyoxylase-like metal-dependent hydrolase (beta-lactamase superfamily II)
MSEKLWEVYAVKYAERDDRTRNDSFMFADDHTSQHPMDYFVWVLRSGEEVIVVDTGYDEAEAGHRARPIMRRPAKAIEALGVRAEVIKAVIITHLHYDHAGTLDDFPQAKFYLQAAEMAYATGPCMCHDVLRMPFTGSHICSAVNALYSGRLHYIDGSEQVADGVSVHCVGGHSKGLQAVRVKTQSGYLCLASDATHYYENFLTGKPFPIVVDLEQMLGGFDLIKKLASRPELVIPGHDPLVRSLFPQEGQSGFVWRLDTGPLGSLPVFG